MADIRFLKESGLEVFTGNELLLKGGLESEMGLITGYPGSPVSEVFDAIFSNRDLLKEHGILGQMANNEGLAAARLNGSRLSSIRAVAVMKSVGMHVAADGIAIGNLTEPNHPGGGCLVVVGDDPWNETTQINSDSRFLSQHLNMPILEPSTFQEIKDWMDVGFELSGKTNLYITYIITTNQADGGGSVEVRPNRYPSINTNAETELVSSQLPVKDLVMIPPHTSQKEATLQDRYQRFISLAREKGINRVLYDTPRKSPIGFIASGMSYCYLEHALFEMGLARKFPILKMGVTYPLDRELVWQFLQKNQRVIVIEEKRPFLENQVRAAFQEISQNLAQSGGPQIFGKKFPLGLEGIPEVRGINTSLLIEKLARLFLHPDLGNIVSNKGAIEEELKIVEETASYRVKVPVRTPTFCPGCPHRDSATISLKLKKDFNDPDFMNKKSKEPTDVIFHGESGCHSMLQFAPNEGLMQDYSGMGLGGGTGAGIDPFIKNKQVVFVGDSTFFHSGMIAVSDSIKNNQDITYIILDNKTTAMTGHQPTPGNDFDVLGRQTFAQKIESVIRGMTGGENVPIVRANPADRKNYSELVEELVLKPGVKIVIADKECGITYQRRLKKEKKETLLKQGFLKKEEFININADACEYCLECTRSTGCPGLTVVDTDFGPKIATDLTTCVSDEACTKAKVCPSFERVIVRRKNPPRKKEFLVQEISLPALPEFDSSYYISTFAVGGMGGGVVSAILVRAGSKQGYKVSFLDKKGLAIRNGSVYGHILYSKNKDQVLGPTVPYGKANLILGIDILETARGFDPKLNMRIGSLRYTSAIVNTHKNQTVLSLMGLNDFDPEVMEKTIKTYTRPEKYFGFNFSEISQTYFGSKLYVNIMLIGAAFQKGLIPITLKNLESSIKETVSKNDLQENMKAFQLGRQIVLSPEKFAKEIQAVSLPIEELIRQKSEDLSRRLFIGKRLGRRYRKMMEDARRWIQLEESTMKKIVVRVYELIQYGDIEYAEKYLKMVWDVYRKDREEMGYGATLAVIENLFKVMAIKDEVYVAHLLTAKEKLEKDRARYGFDPANGDRVSYVHLNRPHFDVLGFEFEFDLNSRNWMLNIFKYCKFFRAVFPGWHHREKDFRDWYIELVKKFNLFQDDQVYRSFVEILSCANEVRGYRKIRYPKMEEARRKVDSILMEIGQKVSVFSRSSIVRD